ncbi:MAG: methionyl-tRNA formyltransferase [Patescibacteria group bacterium]|nr:methionyl-tRNA formyltransferase [Patescibacteria group bacterium]
MNSQLKKVKVVFFGTPDFVVPILEKIRENIQLTAVVTAPDKKVGRKQTLTPTPVAQAAQKNNLPVLKPERLDEEFIKNNFKILDVDLFIVAAFGKIIPQNLLNIPKFGSLNVHPSLLPKYRGPSPIQNAVLNGDKTSGISIIKMDEQTDHGPIVYTREIMLSHNDNFQTLGTKMFAQAADLLTQIIPEYLAEKITPQPQNDQKATYTKIITKEDGYFNIDNPPSLEKLDKMVRAYYPWPTVWTKWEGKIVKFLPDKMVQMEGKTKVKLEEFLRGYPNFPIKTI